MQLKSFDDLCPITKASWLFIINPKAKKIDVNHVCRLINETNTKGTSSCYFFITAYRKHATKICSDAIVKGFKTIIGVGGDGTINEIINGIMSQTVVPSTDVYFGILPAGTGNDWAKTYSFPNNLSACFDIILKRKTFLQDIGKVNYYNNQRKETRFFNNVAGMAYDAYVVEQLESKQSKPNRFIYLLSVFKYLMKYKLQKAHIITDQQEFKDKYYTINIGICKYSGGGMSLVPHAVPNDGLLALTMAGELSKWDILLNTYRFYNLSLLEHAKVLGLHAKHLIVKSQDNETIPLEVDGELLGHTPAEFSIIPQSLRIIIP